VARCARPGSPLTRHPLGGHQWLLRLAVLGCLVACACHQVIKDPAWPGPQPAWTHEDVIVTIVDSSGMPLPGVVVTLEYSVGGTPTACRCATGSEGTAGFRAIPSDSVDIFVRMRGFGEVGRRDFLLNPAKVVELTLVLKASSADGPAGTSMAAPSVGTSTANQTPLPSDHVKCTDASGTGAA
jgi:hypothetical protein